MHMYHQSTLSFAETLQLLLNLRCISIWPAQADY